MAKISLYALSISKKHTYDRVPRDKLWKVLQEYGVNGQLLRAIKYIYCWPDVCVWVNGKQSKPFHVGVVLRQGSVLSPLLFIDYMNWIDKCSQADESAMIGNCEISRQLFADYLVLLFSTESGLQRALNSFADAYDTAGIKISSAQNWNTSSFKKLWSVRVASKWSNTDRGVRRILQWGFSKVTSKIFLRSTLWRINNLV